MNSAMLKSEENLDKNVDIDRSWQILGRTSKLNPKRDLEVETK